MKTVIHIKAGNKGHPLTDEEMLSELDVYRASRSAPRWPVEIFRMQEGDSFLIVPEADLTPEETHILAYQVSDALKDPQGAIIFTRGGIHLHRVDAQTIRTNVEQ